MSRVLVGVTVAGGSVGLIVPWMDLDLMDWTEYLRPLAELIPDGEWSFTPIPDDMDDRKAMGLR